MSDFIATAIEIARTHRDLAYALTFLLAMSEALPVAGALVPGTAVIVGLSALIPSGAVDLLPMAVSATLGAIAGDGISYWLGRRYHRDILRQWPFNRYLALIARGEAFFRRHGGKSVFIARFTPGVRAVVPLSAGILLMSAARFYIMNVLSALLWAPSHVLAGAALGASFALLGAIAGRLAVFVVVLVALLWAIALAMRYAIRRLPRLAAQASDRLCAWLGTRTGWLSRQLLSLLDPARQELPGLALLGALLVGGLWLFFGILEDVVSGDPLVRADMATFHFLQSLRTSWVDQVMVAVTELGDPVMTAAVAALTLLWLARRRAWRAGAYEIAAVGAALIFTLLIKATLYVPRPREVSLGWDAFTFPSGQIAVSAALYTFLTILVAWEAGARLRLTAAIGAALLVSSIGLSRLYLGAGWLSGVLGGLAFGVAGAALLGIAYLRHSPPRVGAGGLCAMVAATLVIGGTIHIDRQHAGDLVRYAARETTRTMRLAQWWQSGWSTLPTRRVDLVGAFEEPLTVQWAGGIEPLKRALVAEGWYVPVPWTVRSALAWLAPFDRGNALPVLPRLEDGREARLVMAHAVENEAAARLVLRLWKSDVDLTETGTSAVPLWIGMVTKERFKRVMAVLTIAREQADFNAPRAILAAAIPVKRLAARGRSDRGAGWDGLVLLGRPAGPSAARRGSRSSRRAEASAARPSSRAGAK